MIWCTRNLTNVSEFWNEIIPEFTYLFLEEDVDKEEVYKMGSVLGEGDGYQLPYNHDHDGPLKLKYT
jgi:hypothetical protein